METVNANEVYLCGFQFKYVCWYMLCRNRYEAEIMSQRDDMTLMDIKRWAKNRKIKIYPFKKKKGLFPQLECYLHRRDLKRFGVLSDEELFLACIFDKSFFPTKVAETFKKDKDYYCYLKEIRKKYMLYMD